MEKTPSGTSVGVDDPYAYADRCDYVTGDGKCRYAVDFAQHDPEFAAERRAEEFRCPVADGDADWQDCSQFRCRNRDRECIRCGLEETRMAHTDERPLLEEHHLSYDDGDELTHEITVYLCRWCHAKVHTSWARITDDVNPDPDALAAREQRRGRELDELSFTSAADRFESDE